MMTRNDEMCGWMHGRGWDQEWSREQSERKSHLRLYWSRLGRCGSDMIFGAVNQSGPDPTLVSTLVLTPNVRRVDRTYLPEHKGADSTMGKNPARRPI